jgi:hypothetical protein
MEQKMILNEVVRIKQLMSLLENSSMIISESSGTPIEKLLEKLGIRAESDFTALEQKVAANSATEEEVQAYNLMKKTMDRLGKTADDILQNPSAYSAQLEDEFEKIIKSSPAFGEKMLNTFLEVNPQIKDMILKIDTEIVFKEGQVTTVNTIKKINLLKKQIDTLDIPQYLKTMLNNKLDKQLDEIETQVEKVLEQKTIEANKFIDEIELKFADDWETMKKVYNLGDTQKEKFNQALQRSKEIMDGIIKDIGKNNDTYEAFKNFKKQLEALDPTVWFKAKQKLGQAWDWISKKLKGKWTLAGISGFVVILSALCGMSDTICKVLRGIFGGIIEGGGKLFKGVPETPASPETPAPPAPPAPSDEPQPGTLDHFKKLFPKGIQGKDQNHFKSSGESTIEYFWNNNTKNYDF